jgi:hypothetical protein
MTLPQMAQNSFHDAPKAEPKGLLDTIWNNDAALGGVIVAIVFGLFFVMGYTVVRYAMASDKVPVANSNQAVTAKAENNSSRWFQEAEDQAKEAAADSKNAGSKEAWMNVYDKYKRAYSLMAAIDKSSPEYTDAQQKMMEYKQMSEAASYKASNYKTAPSVNYPVTTTYPATNSYSNPSSNYSSSSSSYSSSYSSPTPTPALKVSMPAKQSYRTYLSYSYVNYNKLENKVITTNDAVFTTSVEKMSENRRDSGVVRITVDGGSYASARLAFKAPYGQKVTAGSFPNAQEYLWQSPTMYAMSFDKVYCSSDRANHSFTINSIIYDELYSSIAFIDASFTVNCGTNKAMGRIRYDAR